MATMSRSIFEFADVMTVRWACGFAAALLLAEPSCAHTLTIMRVTPGKLAAGDTATVAARFEFDATACAVQVDFGDGTPAQTTTITAAANASDAPLALQHVYAQAGAYMVSLVPVAHQGTPKCAGGKHSTLIEVQDAGAAPAEPATK